MQTAASPVAAATAAADETMTPSSPVRLPVSSTSSGGVPVVGNDVTSPATPTTPASRTPSSASTSNNSTNDLPSRSSLRNDASGLPPCLRRFHEQRKRASEEVHNNNNNNINNSNHASNRGGSSLLLVPPAFQTSITAKRQRQKILKDLTRCDNAIPSPRLRIQKNLSLKRASWQQLVRSSGAQVETLNMLKEVARQARLLSKQEEEEQQQQQQHQQHQQQEDAGVESAPQCSSNNIAAATSPTPVTRSTTGRTRTTTTNAKAMLSASQHNKRLLVQKKRNTNTAEIREKRQQERTRKTRRRNQAATQIQSGYRMYCCRLVYLRDLRGPRRSSSKATPTPAEKQPSRGVERHTSEITMSDFNDTVHTLEDISLHLMMQKVSRHSTQVSDFDDSFASLGDIPFSPKTNMQRNNHSSLSNSLKLAPSLSPLPATTASPSTSNSKTVSTSGADTIPTCPLLTGSFSSLPVRPAMLSSAAPTATAALVAVPALTSGSNCTTTLEAAAASNPMFTKGYYSCSSFFNKDEDFLLGDLPPLERLDSSFRRRGNESLSPPMALSSGHVSMNGSLVGDTPARRPNRLPSAHVRKEDIEDTGDDDDDDSDDISLDVMSFSEEVHHYEDHATTTTITTNDGEDGSILPPNGEGGDDVMSPATKALAASARWSEEELDISRYGHTSCLSFFGPPSAQRAPDTPVLRPTRKLSPHYLMMSCPQKRSRKPMIKRPEPEDCEDDLKSPRAPARGFSKHAPVILRHQLQQLQLDDSTRSTGTSTSRLDAPVRAPTRKKSSSSTTSLVCGRDDDGSVSSALSTGPSLHRRLEQYVRPSKGEEKQATASEESQRESPSRHSLPPPAPAPVTGHRTPPATTYSGDTLISMPTRKQSVETSSSSSSSRGGGGTGGPKAKNNQIMKSSSIHETSPKCIMELAAIGASSSSDGTSSEEDGYDGVAF